MILLVENITNKVLGTYSEYAYSPETQNAYSVLFNGEIPKGSGTLFYDNGTLFFVEYSDLEYIKIQIKNNRQILVENIEVEYNGKIYQGDEVSQGRMSRVISSMLDTDTIMWKAKDNSKVKLTKIDLTQILRLSTIEQTKVW